MDGNLIITNLAQTVNVSANKFTICYNDALNVKRLGHKPTNAETGTAQSNSQKNGKPPLSRKIKRAEFFGIQDFADFLKKGHTIYAGVFIEGVTSACKKQVDYSRLISVDCDFPSVLLDDVRQDPFVKQYGAIAHPSYRAVLDNLYKFHLYFITDRNINADEYRKIWKVITLKLGLDIDESKKGAENLFYGSLHDPIILNEDAYLPVTELLEEFESKFGNNKSVEKSQQKNSVSNGKRKELDFWRSQTNDSSDGITKDNLQHIWSGLLEKHNGDILEAGKAVCFEKAYKLNLRSASISDEEKELGIIMKLEGCNPFHPSTTGEGDSFVISFFDNGLPPVFYDRSCTYKEFVNGRERNGGSIISYWKGINPKLYKDVEGGKEYQKMIHALCDELKIERFNFKTKIKAEEIYDALREFLADKVYRLGWDESHFFHYRTQSKTWAYASSTSYLYSTLIKPFIVSEFGLKVAEDPKVIRLVSTWLSNHDFEVLDCTLEERLRYTPFTNGFFDIETKELIPEKIDAYNQHRITFDYFDVSDDNETIQRFKKYWGHWLKDNELGDLLLNWIILNAQRQAYKTGMMVGLVGDSGIGKSAFGALIHGLFDRSGFAKRMPGDFLTSKNNSHATASLEGCYSVILEELKGETEFTSAEKIKDFTGDKKESTITINPKGQKERDITLRLGITFNCEGTLVLKAKEAGFYRRSVIIPVYAAKSKSEANGAESDYLRQPENLKKILCWCQKQDTEVALKRFAEVAKSPKVENFKRAMKFENNLIAQFLDEMVTITNDKKHFLTAKDLHTAYLDWCFVNKHRELSQAAFGREIRRVARSTDISEDFNWLEEFAEMTGQQRIPNDKNNKAVLYFGLSLTKRDVSVANLDTLSDM